MTKLLIGGHSHMVCMLSGHRGASDTPQIIPLGDGRAFALIGKWPRDDDYWNALAKASDDYTVVLLWGGNEHNSYHLLQRERFDFFMSDDDEIDRSATIVPLSMIKSSFALTLAHMRDFLQHRIKSASNAFVVGTPPPLEDDSMVLERIKQQWDLTHIADDEVVVTRAALRLKLWRVLNQIRDEYAMSAGARVLPVPPGAQDERGFLDSKYWAPSATHANEAYGQLVLEYVKEHVQ